jgi:hypothetical protein
MNCFELHLYILKKEKIYDIHINRSMHMFMTNLEMGEKNQYYEMDYTIRR